MKKTIILALALSMSAIGFAQSNRIVYPKTAKVDTVDVYFGTKVADPYRWLENDTSAATAQWVKAENMVTFDYLSKIPFRNALLQRLKELANYEKTSLPEKRNDKYLFFKNNGLQNQNVIYIANSLKGEQRVFLDPNKLSTDGTVALQSLTFSKDNKYAAYSISRSGSDWNEIYVMDAVTGKLLPDHLVWCKFCNPSWYKDGFYYSAYDAPVSGKELSNVNENHKVYYHKLGTEQAQDKLVYQDPTHPKRFFDISTDEDQTVEYLMSSGEGSGNIISVRPAGDQNKPFATMTTNMNNIYSPVDVIGNKIYMLTNDGAPHYRLMVADLNNPEVSNWKVLIPESKDVLSDAQIIGGKLFLTYTKDVANHAYVYTLDGKLLHEIKLPSVGTVTFSGKKDSKECFFNFVSFNTPGTNYTYNMDNNTYTLLNAPKIKFNSADYVTEQVFCTSKDGTRVPMFITYKKGLKRNGNNPLLLYGYGGFNIGITPHFSTSYIPFLERGGIFAVANIRGGNEYGEKWHLAGTKMQKQNVFDDFISAAEYLIKSKYTNKENLAIMGGSNGGLLVGACITQRPDLFRVAIAEVGVMDMLRYHLFTIGWNWASDYGTSADSKQMFEYLKGYSPLHNIRPGVKYPATLITTADHDDRVVPAHSFKFAATMQECNAGTNPILIRIDSKAGHGGGKPLSKYLEEMADTYSFILYNLGHK
jgi:prolyl oligopeptidase